MELVKVFKRYFITIKDLGLLKFLRTIIFRLLKIYDSFYPHKKSYLILKNLKIFKTPFFTKKFLKFETLDLPINLNGGNMPKKFKFKFLNSKIDLDFPINWNNLNLTKLWIFNLNYFSWAKDLLNDYLSKDFLDIKLIYLGEIIDCWIEKTSSETNFSWHSYPTSLRIKNWIFIFLFCPLFIKENRIDSLWRQIRWLSNHKEIHIGGNHYLENLFALIIGSLCFEGSKANSIFTNSLLLLERELKRQILLDGGHEERSASYHLLILEGLIEVACFINIFKSEIPSWLINSIEKMTIWAKTVRINSGKFPRFNDSPVDGCKNIDEVINFAECFLNGKKINIKNVNSLLLKTASYEGISKRLKFKEKKIIDLPNTGWTIIRPNNKWELFFKCGLGCPYDLPGHVHSDQLSFDLFYRGIPIISEVGTSTYHYSKERIYERSGAAHNIFQLSEPINKHINREKKWIETYDVWNNFRAGFKSKPKNKKFSEDENSFLWVQGGHDGYDKFSSTQKRIIKCRIQNGFFELHIENYISLEKNMYWREFWHLGPQLNENLVKNISIQLSNANSKLSVVDSWHAEGFGIKIPRKTIVQNGYLSKGKYCLKKRILMKENPF